MSTLTNIVRVVIAIIIVLLIINIVFRKPEESCASKIKKVIDNKRKLIIKSNKLTAEIKFTGAKLKQSKKNLDDMKLNSKNQITSLENQIKSCNTKFIFYPNVDSNGEDIRNVGNKTILELKNACVRDPNCIAFNTDGWLKSKIKTPTKWGIRPGNKYSGLYIKEDNAPISPDRLYVKISGHDSNGGDIGNYKTRYHNIKNYGLLCVRGKMKTKCKGFNSAGWFKKSITDASNFTKVAHDLYIRLPYVPSDINKVSPRELVVF